jgi:hypothetical protein
MSSGCTCADSKLENAATGTPTDGVGTGLDFTDCRTLVPVDEAVDDAEEVAASEIAAGATDDALVAFPPEHAFRVAAANPATVDSAARLLSRHGLSTTDDMEIPEDIYGCIYR